MKKNNFTLIFISLTSLIFIALYSFIEINKYAGFILIPILIAYYIGQYAERKYSSR